MTEKTRIESSIVTSRPRSFLNGITLVSKALPIAIASAQFALAEPQHGLAMAGDPALEPGFDSLPYANPDAPKGGRIVLAERGGFDSLNPYILKGSAPWGIRTHVVESLMGRNWDEPFTLYGLLAETIEVPDDRSWVEFTLRPEARFSNGDPVTVADVIWSFTTLGAQGHPRYANSWTKVDTVEQTGPRSLRISFNTPDRELPLILGLRPVLRKADWAGRDFTESGMTPITGSGPYVIGDFEPGRFISFKRNPDYWGAGLGLKAGQDNFDEIRYDYYLDAGVVLEAFKAGAISVLRETDPGRWADSYDFPRMRSGAVVRSEIPHGRPSGMAGFVFNTRRDIFADWRVREALILAFNFEFVNKALNGSSVPRIQSYFHNSDLARREGPAAGRVARLLAPFRADLLPGTLEGYALPVSDGSARNRRNLRKAAKLLEEAGWTVRDGQRVDDAGRPFRFAMLLKNGSTDQEAMANLWQDALQRLGVQMEVQLIDAVQHRERLNNYDFDMAYYFRPLSLSPGNEQMLYWGSAGVTQPGTRNYMGINSPAAEAMINAMLTAETREDFVAAVRALDRILLAGRYVVPIWFQPESYLAHDATLKYPEKLPVYGDWQGFLPDVWWRETP